MIQDHNITHKIKTTLQETNNMLPAECAILRTEILKAIDKLAQPMQLAIIGKISSSKSTLVNAILEMPELVRTGSMEETWNVSWIKYGDPESEIKVHYKNSDIVDAVPRRQWTEWANRNRKNDNQLKNSVSYIEVLFNNEILQKVNIIDTPGLDALAKIDSQNTLEFLAKVQPDAVFLLFTHGSIANSTLDIVKDFEQSNHSGFNIRPINAVGVLAKSDMLWSVGDENCNVLSDGYRLINDMYKKSPSIRNTIFSIIPISALMGMASSTINVKDIDTLRKLSLVSESTMKEMLSSSDFFKDQYYDVGVSPLAREQLELKLGRYSINLLIKLLRVNPLINLEETKSLLHKESGFSDFMRLLFCHFGERASLIKVQSSFSRIFASCKQTKQETNSKQIKDAIDNIHSKLLALLLSIHEYQELELLNVVYDGSLKLSDGHLEEVKRLLGESGYSLIERLNLSHSVSVNEIREVLENKIDYWHKRCIQSAKLTPTDSKYYKTILESCNKLLVRLIDSESSIIQLHAQIEYAEHGIWGKYNKSNN